MREYGRRSLTGPAPQPVAFLLCMRRTTRRQNDLTAMQMAATPTARTNAARPCRKFAGISHASFRNPRPNAQICVFQRRTARFWISIRKCFYQGKILNDG